MENGESMREQHFHFNYNGSTIEFTDSNATLYPFKNQPHGDHLFIKLGTNEDGIAWGNRFFRSGIQQNGPHFWGNLCSLFADRSLPVMELDSMSESQHEAYIMQFGEPAMKQQVNNGATYGSLVIHPLTPEDEIMVDSMRSALANDYLMPKHFLIPDGD